MKYNNVNIIFCWLPFGQGLTINSKLCLVKYVKDTTKQKVHLDTTCQVIQHELQHCKDIIAKGWFNFMVTTLWHYIWNKHDESGWEGNANDAEKNIDIELRISLIKHLVNKEIQFYN